MDNIKAGWVYVLSDQRGFYKIGKASILDRRIKQLKIQLPYAVKLFLAVNVDNFDQVETWFHRKFASQRVNGEWFALDSKGVQLLIEYVMRIDGTLGLQHTYSENSKGQFVKDYIAMLEDIQSRRDLRAGDIFHHFTLNCIDEACDRFGLPYGHETGQEIAPSFYAREYAEAEGGFTQ